MASKLSKLCPRILVSSIAVFIFLSDCTVGVAEKPTRCYWCGPLAEQVHRSQRAPSCDQLERRETVCDNGYTHCAIVATSPPYAESRLCVKFYQDECYSLYCNSTKTWRMICACRGDLCNGPHADRERKAFSTLPKAIEKNARIKRALISDFVSVKTKSPPDNNTIIIINNKTEHIFPINNVQGDQAVEDKTQHTNAAEDMPKHIEENIIIEHGTVKHKDRKLTYNNNFPDTTTDVSKVSDDTPTMMTIENRHDTKSDKITTREYTTTAHIAKETDGPDVTMYTSSKPTSIEIELAVIHNSATSDKLPPAEALQQNGTPTQAMGTAVTSTEMNQMTEITTLPDELKKNNGAQNLLSLIILVIIFILHIQ